MHRKKSGKNLGERDIREFAAIFWVIGLLGAALLANGIDDCREINRLVRQAEEASPEAALTINVRSMRFYSDARMIVGGLLLLLGCLPMLLRSKSKGRQNAPTKVRPGFGWIVLAISVAAVVIAVVGSIMVCNALKLQRDSQQIAVLLTICIVCGISAFMAVGRLLK